MLKTPKKFYWWRIISICLPLGIFAYTAKTTFCLLKWKAYIWFPSFVYSEVTKKEEVPDREKHLIFLMVDHYEPGKGEKGAMFNEAWLKKFRKIADKHFDSYSNHFRYTWFYPYDHHNEEVLISLCKMAFDGFGEVELHWHLPPTKNETYPAMLGEAIQWFQQYGALISSQPPHRTHFAYVAGNWSLDNCDGRSGINNQLDTLFRSGCYADFTFSTIHTQCQPKKINSLYYVSDDPKNSKSYDDGVDAEVGKHSNNQLMIFQGPIAFNWKKAGLEYGAVETDPLPSRDRINLWIDTNIHVKGRPEWVFVKVYTHGCQSADTILNYYLDLMLQWLEEICKERRISLHYMTAREAYNVVKAAEDGKEGNPDKYRDYKIPKAWNMVFHTKAPVFIK